MINIESEVPFSNELLEQAAHAALTHQKESLDVDLSIVLDR